MESNLATFAERTGIEVRYGCTWQATRRDGERFVLTTSDGDYRCLVPVFAVGVAEPWTPAFPGVEHAAHYADTRPGETYAGKRVFIFGKENSGFELATGFLPWAKQIAGARSPSTCCRRQPPRLPDRRQRARARGDRQTAHRLSIELDEIDHY